MHKLLLDLPTCLETERLHLRCYHAGDGPLLYAVSQANREHLARYESENVLMSIKTPEDAEVIARDLANAWARRDCFFLGAFEKQTGAFAAQIYIGPVNWDLPEFELGYFADKDHEGQGYVTEAATAALQFIFEHLKAYRVRLGCNDTNVRSSRVAERCGFRREGHIREHRKHADGTFSGTLQYGLLHSESESHRILGAKPYAER
ncbi:MAG TPA: GNAT family protein [Anaerolineales bacterium]|nr:GNAT family protein [Anaerolineales bacterium]